MEVSRHGSAILPNFEIKAEAGKQTNREGTRGEKEEMGKGGGSSKGDPAGERTEEREGRRGKERRRGRQGRKGREGRQ